MLCVAGLENVIASGRDSVVNCHRGKVKSKFKSIKRFIGSPKSEVF